MELWNKVSKTNPRNTKKVNQRGGFTSICAQSQIMEATRAFGPIGEGWGYTASTPFFHDNLAFVSVTLWHGDRSNVFGPLTGGAEWKDKNGRLDSDCTKKATTDAVTKLLSQLGFNADVFLGLFDDNKYVQAVEREFAQQEQAPLPTGPISDETRSWIESRLASRQLQTMDLCKAFDVTSLAALTYERMDDVKNWIRDNTKEAA